MIPPCVRRFGPMRSVGAVLVGSVLLAAVLGPAIEPNDTGHQHRDFVFAPPMRIHVVDAEGGWHAPYVHAMRLQDRLERRYEEDPSARLTLEWFSGRRLVRLAGSQPLLLLGGDSLGRDIFSRLVDGTRWSLGVAAVAVLGALLIGGLIGGIAGYAGGLVDEILMRGADFVVVLPTIYVVLALRALMPLVLSAGVVFALIGVLLSLVGWPWVARGVRSIVASEAGLEYAAAARSLGAGHVRLLMYHLLPASRGFLIVQATLLLPAFVLAEATLSYVGLGFPEPTPSWGAMLRDTANVRAMADFPWLLAPAVAIVTFVMGVNMLTRSTSGAGPILGRPSATVRPAASGPNRRAAPASRQPAPDTACDHLDRTAA